MKKMWNQIDIIMLPSSKDGQYQNIKQQSWKGPWIIIVDVA